MTATVANIRDGFPPNGVYIGRPGRGMAGPWGNQFGGRGVPRDVAISRFREWFHSRVVYDKDFRAKVVRELDGKVLVCFCAPLPCHGDVIAEFLNGPAGQA